MKTQKEMYELLKENPYFEYFMLKNMIENANVPEYELRKRYAEENEIHKNDMIKYINPFMHILHFEEKYFDSFKKGDNIIIQEKIDGANSHFHIINETPTAFGNHYILNEWNNNQGFYFWVQKNYKKVIKKYWNLDIYGEWLAPHHNQYPSNCYGEFYVFDIIEGADENGLGGIYWPQYKVKKFTEDCGFNYAPILFKGSFTKWTDVMTYVGKTCLGGNKGEGIVIKNQSHLNDWRHPFYVKIVDIEFQETNESRKIIKTVDMQKIIQMEELKLLVENVVTLPRIRKIILKMVEEKELNCNWYKMPIEQSINMVKRVVFQDCKKEVPEVIEIVGKNFGKYCSEFTIKHMEHIKNEFLK